MRDAAGGAGERAPWRPCDVPLASRWPLWSPLPRPPPVPGVLAGTYLKRIKAKYYRVGRPVYTKLDLAQQVRDDCTASTYDRPQAQEELHLALASCPASPLTRRCSAVLIPVRVSQVLVVIPTQIRWSFQRTDKRGQVPRKLGDLIPGPFPRHARHQPWTGVHRRDPLRVSLEIRLAWPFTPGFPPCRQ